jgi:cytochrome P450
MTVTIEQTTPQTLIQTEIARSNISESKANPFPFYAYLRANAPVYQMIMPTKQKAWLVTRYDDVALALKDERFVKNRRTVMTPEQLKKQPWVPGMFKPLETNMLDQDAPNHTRLRGLVHKAFTPRLIEQMRGRIETLANELLDAAEYKATRGGVDLMRDYALPLPLTIIAEILGVPTADKHKFHNWTKIMVESEAHPNLFTLIPNAWRFMNYLRKLFRERRVNPQDDLVSALVQAENAGDTLSEDELLSTVIVLIIAGHETTVNLIGSGTLALLEHPDQLAKLRSNPSLIQSAIEELLRYTSPVELATERYTREDVTIAGTTIPRGELVRAVIASANRDENYFNNPDDLDIERENNRHLAFGLGAHYCAGAPLARLEGQIAINALVQRMPNLRLKVAPDALKWRAGITLRGLEALPVLF